jgi:hypothetical protein
MTEIFDYENQHEINKYLFVTAAGEGDLDSLKRFLFERKVDVNVYVRVRTIVLYLLSVVCFDLLIEKIKLSRW